MNRPAAVFDRLGTLADPTRTRILLILEGAELTVSELCSVLQLPQSTVSRHLKILSDERWITARDSGASRFYTLVPSRLDAVAKRLWQVVREQYSASPSAQQDARRKDSVLGSRRVKMHTFFTGMVGRWDQVRTDLIGARTDLLALLDLLDPDLTIGDLGCGTGPLSEALAPVVQRVIAIDESGAMLTEARKKLAAFGNAEVRSGSLEALPVDDGELDVALLFMVTHFVIAPVQVLSEVRRALTPGGRMLMLDLTAHEREEYSMQMGHIWQGFTESQLRAWVEDAGLTVVRYRELPADPKAKGPALFSLLVQKGKRSRG